MRATLIWMATFTACCVSAASGQAPSTLSLDLNVGRGIGRTGGIYNDNSSGITADVMASLRMRTYSAGSLLAGLGGGIQGAGTSTLECIPHPEGGCVPGFPEFAILAAMIGWENPSGVVRAFAGPAIAHADATTAAFVVRGDVALPLVSRVWLTAGVRGAYVPDYEGDAFRLVGIGFGVRIR